MIAQKSTTQQNRFQVAWKKCRKIIHVKTYGRQHVRMNFFAFKIKSQMENFPQFHKRIIQDVHDGN